MSVELLEELRRRVLPMLQYVADAYGHRTPDGYPMVVDAVESGTVGLELDPSYALYLVSEGNEVFADFFVRSSRTDARSSASREKFSGMQMTDRRQLPASATDQDLRNLLAELMARFNVQPGLIHVTDS